MQVWALKVLQSIGWQIILSQPVFDVPRLIPKLLAAHARL